MKYIKITCPCKRPHQRRYDADVSYTEDECNKLEGFIGVESELTYFAHHCTDCKKVVLGKYEDGIVTLEISDKRIQTLENPTVITI